LRFNNNIRLMTDSVTDGNNVGVTDKVVLWLPEPSSLSGFYTGKHRV